MNRMHRMSPILAALALAGGYERPGRHAKAPPVPRRPEKRNRAARRANRKARQGRFARSQQRMDELRGQVNLGELKPVHPRDRYWYDVGLNGGTCVLQPPTHGGGSYYARYRAMYEAGAKARKAAA